MLLRKVVIMNNINILPADTYIVINKTILTEETRKIINMLYQPIIGSIPVMLYFSLWSDLDKTEIISTEYKTTFCKKEIQFHF